MRTLTWLMMAVVTFVARAEPADRDLLAGNGTAFNNNVTRIVVLPNDHFIVGGSFTAFNGVQANRIVQLKPDGSIDSSLATGSGFDGTVTAIGLDNSGRILIGGNFTHYQGTPVKKVVRLSSTGVLDQNFNNKVPALTGAINCFAFQGARILVGGQFSAGILRLNNDGSKDLNFAPGTGLQIVNSTLTRSANCIVVQPTGNIIIGGSFNRWNGTPVSHIVGLDANGTQLSTQVFNSADGFKPGSAVNDMKLQPDGKIVAAGPFSSYGGFVRKHIIRLLANGDVDTTFNPNGSFEIDAATIHSVAVQSDGRIIAGGAFSLVNTPNMMMARLNCNGTLDPSFDPGNPGFSASINAVALMGDGRILVGGAFGKYRNLNASRIVRLKGTQPIAFSSCIIAAPSSDSVCSDTPVTLTATGGGSYLWDTGETSASITVRPGSSATYSVIVTTSDGCSMKCSKTIQVLSSPTCNITAFPTSGIICPGHEATLFANSTGTSYQWFVEGQDLPPPFIVNPDGKSIRVNASGTYTVRVTHANGCVSSCSQRIQVSPSCSIRISPLGTQSAGSLVTLTAFGGSANASYAWSTGASTRQIIVKPLRSTAFTVTITEPNGCSVSCSKNVTVQ
jgi:uncharacterized delta-60 repeat protein